MSNQTSEMKKISPLIIFIFTAALSYSQQNFHPRELTGNEANKVWQGAEHIWLKQENAVPAFIEFRTGSEPDETAFFTILQKTFRLPSSYSFKLKNTETDQLGWQHKRFQMMVNNVPVTNGIFLLHLQTGKVKKFNGYLFKNVSVNTSASISESSALEFALKKTDALVYKWQLREEEEFLKRESGNPDATFFPKGELEIFQVGDNSSAVFKLVWKFDIYAHEPMSRNYVYVDAANGDVLKTATRIHDANTNGTAVTAYRGAKPIVADSYNGAYRLYETTRGNGVRTRNMLKGTSYGAAVEFSDADNYWNNVNANLDQYAGDAHWGAEMTYDFYLTMGRNSINGNGYLLNLYVHYNTNYVNAFWDGTRMTFGDGNATYDPLTTLDITGHEITHGLDEFTANLDYSYEPGALNESFSDIFGAAVEWYADSAQANWLIGEDIGGAFRSMSNPNAYGDPDTYLGTNWYTGTADYGGVHTNSGVQNHWYYRLVLGGSGTNDIGNAFSVVGIGRNKANQIAWRNLVNYLTSTSDYADARFYAIQAANDLFGACSQEVASTTKAWYAVGVGGDYVSGADAQFSASPLTGCALPFTVNFTNASTNATSYVWYFGDGTSSTTANPSHTYTLPGVYTVKLVANSGGACGSDSVVYTNLINVSPSNPCVVILPLSGSHSLQTSCTGTIYDSGGPTGNYTGNTSSTVTIAPPGASQVTIHFTQFDMEAGYDYLYVYDGPTTASPVIGSFTGTTIPADVTSSGGSITVRQYSDPYVEGAGFTIQWTCITPTNPPVANFKADVTQTCTGNIRFTDLTTGGATSWLWNFGDGNTSTQQHPVHSYLTNGTFTVSLQATNAYGNNTNTKNNYITVSKPAGPAIANPSGCGASSFVLSVSDVNPVTWFDNNGNAISGSNPFTTPVLNNTTLYYVQDTQPQPIYNVGPANNSFATGSYFNNNSTLGLKFNVYKKSILVSVLVYASGSGYRTIQYRDSVGGVIAERRLNIPNGQSRVTLNIDLEPGSSYILGVRDTANFFRNNSTSVNPFPFTDANGMVQIYGNNTTTAPNNYYYYYDWEVKEQDCISERVPVTVTIHPALAAAASSTPVSCNGGSNGSVTVTPSGGTPSFSYSWNNSGNTASISNVASGTYTVTITDAHSCSATSSVTVTQPAPLSPSATITNVLCYGENNGAINLNVTGGTTSYSFNWGGGITSQNRTSLTAGTYSVTVTDANLCTVTSSANVSEPPSLIATPSVTNVSCNGGNNGAINLNVTGGTTSYSFNWGGGITSQNRTSLTSGNYSATITDANLCTTTSSAIISEPDSIEVLPTVTNIDCYGGNTGAILLSVTGGAPPYTFNWGGSITSQNRSSLVAGIYTVTVTDANLCTLVTSATITEQTAINLSANTVHTTCGLSNGNVSVNPSGGNPGYSYLWNNGETTPSLSNISAGNYFVTVTDNTNCSTITSVLVSSSSALNVSASTVDVNCYGGSDGSASVLVNNGTFPIAYIWAGGETASSLLNVGAGTYNVTVTDANDCTASVLLNIYEPFELTFSITPIHADCNLNNGSATTNVSGGTAGYMYLWSTNETSADIDNLAPGMYSVTVSDSHNCTAESFVSIINASSLVAEAVTENVSCFGFTDGAASINIVSGTAPFTYLWSNGQTASSHTNLDAGVYLVTITDGSNCQSFDTIVIAQPAVISVFFTINNVSCFGANNGSASVSATGGTPNYVFYWSNSQNGTSIANLNSGSYSVTVNDANNCSSELSFTVAQPTEIIISETISDISCFNGTDGTASLSVTGGEPLYSYEWCNGSNSATASNLTAGNCSVTVTDQAGCTVEKSITISEPSEIQFSVSVTDATAGMSNGSIDVSVSGGNAPYIIHWSNGDGNNLTSGTYSFTITDANGCAKTGSAVVDELTGTGPTAKDFSFALYPNPTSDEIILILSEWKPQTVINLKNVLGQILLSKTIYSETTFIALADFASGVYFAEIIQQEKKSVREFVISR